MSGVYLQTSLEKHELENEGPALLRPGEGRTEGEENETTEGQAPRKAVKKIPTEHLRKVLETLLEVVVKGGVRVKKRLTCTNGLLQ